jgi:hypothetical protein
VNRLSFSPGCAGHDHRAHSRTGDQPEPPGSRRGPTGHTTYPASHAPGSPGDEGRVLRSGQVGIDRGVLAGAMRLRVICLLGYTTAVGALATRSSARSITLRR